MKIIRRLLLITILAFSFSISANAQAIDSKLATNAYNVAFNFVNLRRSSAEWSNLSIVNQSELFDTNGELNGYVFDLSSSKSSESGYIITKKALNQDFIVMEASHEIANPFSSVKGNDKVYLGVFNYYQKEGNEFKNLRSNEKLSKHAVFDTFQSHFVERALMDKAVSNRVTLAATTAFLPGVYTINDMPSINQNRVSSKYCSPTAASNVVRYAQLYRGLQYKSGYTHFASQTGFNDMINAMGTKMNSVKTGSRPGTYDTDVAPGFEDFLLSYTSFNAWVTFWKNTSANQSVISFSKMMDYINAGHPVLVTVGNGLIATGSEYHTVTAFGYTSDGFIHVADPNGVNSTDYSGKRLMINYNISSTYYIYAIYRVALNYY